MGALILGTLKRKILSLHRISCRTDIVGFSSGGRSAIASISSSLILIRGYNESAKLSALASPNGKFRLGPSKWVALLSERKRIYYPNPVLKAASGFSRPISQSILRSRNGMDSLEESVCLTASSIRRMAIIKTSFRERFTLFEFCCCI